METNNLSDSAGSPGKTLLAGEGLLIFAVFFFSWAISDDVFKSPRSNFYLAIATTLINAFVFATTCLAMMVSLGLYHDDRNSITPHIITVALKFCVCLLAGSVAVYVLFTLAPYLRLSGSVIVLASSVSLIAVLGLRKIVQLFRSKPSNVLILGADGRAAILATQARQPSNSDTILVKGFVAIPGQPIEVTGSLIFKLDSSLLRKVQILQINEIVIAADDMKAGCGTQQLLDCKLSGIRITDRASFLTRNLLPQLESAKQGDSIEQVN